MLMLLPGALLLLGFAFPAELRVRGPPGPPATLGPPALVSRGSTASVGGPPKTSSEETSSTRWVLSSKSWVGSDVFLTSKYAFLVGLFLIDIPGVTFRLAALLQEGPLEGGPLLCPLLLKNFVWLALRPLRMHQCVLAEKEEAQWFQREVLTVAADALLHPPAPAAADTAAAETPSLFMGHRGLASTPPLPRASLDGTAVPAAARRRPPDKRRQGTARGASQRGRGQRRRESFKPEAAESRAVAAAAAAAVHERQQAFLLHLLGMDPTTCPTSIELSLCSAAAEANDVLIAGPGSPGREEARSAAATAAAEAKARRSASTLTDVQQQRTHRRPLEALLTYKPRRILKLLGKQHEEAQGGTHSAAEAATVATGETAAATATAAAAAAAKGAGASKKHLRPMLPKALTLERLRRLHKEGIRPEGLRSCLSAALESSAAVTASHDSSAAAAAAADAATARENAAAAAAKKAPETAAAEAQAQRQLGRRLGGRLLSLRVLPGRRRSTVPSLLHQTEQQQRRQQQKQQQQQQEKQKLQLSVPLPTCPVRLQSYPGTPADPSEVTVSVTSRAGSPSLSLLQCSSLSPCNRVAALPKGGRPQGPPVHSLQAPHFKPQQVRGDEAPGLGPAARKTHRGPPAVVGKSTEGTPHKPFGCRTPGGPSHSVSLAQAFLNLQAQDSQDYGDSDTSEAAAATPARAAEAVTPAAGCRTCSSISTIHPLPYTDEARAAFATAAAAPAVAAAAAAATAHSELKTKDGENVDTPNNCCCCSWLLHLGRRQREVSQPQQQHRSQQQHHQQQQNRQQRRSRDIMVQHLQQGVAKGHSSSYPSKQLMESLRKRQQLLLQQQLPLKGVGIGVLLHRLLRLLLCPRGRGFAAIIDDGVCMQRKQQLLLAALAAAPHLAKLLLILRPFLGLLPLLQHLQQPQQDEQQPADGAAAPRSNSVDTVGGEGSLLLLVLLSLQFSMQCLLYLCISLPLLDVLFVSLGGCLRLASLHALLLTVETVGRGGGSSSLYVGTTLEGAPQTDPAGPLSAAGDNQQQAIAPFVLRLLLCLPPVFALLQLLLPICSLLCLRRTISCCKLVLVLLLVPLCRCYSRQCAYYTVPCLCWVPAAACRRRATAAAAAAASQHQQQQVARGNALGKVTQGTDDLATPAGTAGVLLLLLCSNMGAPLSLHPLLIGGPLIRSVRLCDQLLQQHFCSSLLLLCSRGVTAGWAPGPLLLVIHLCYFCFCCFYLMLSCSVRLLQLRKQELLLQLQLLMQPEQARSPASTEAAAAAAAAVAASNFNAATSAAAAAPGDNSMTGRRARAAAASAAAAVAAAAAAPHLSPYILLSDVWRHLEIEGFFSSPGTIWPPC